MKTATTCKRCGTPIPQLQGRGRPRLYCEGTDCQATAKRTRALRRTTPGLEGALARAEDLYERMETELAAALQPLAEALAAELDPAGVEATIAQAAAAADARVAAARAERDDAIAKATTAHTERDTARAEATAAKAETLAARESEAQHAEAAAIAEHRATRAEATARESETAAAQATETAAIADRARTTALADRDTAIAEAAAAAETAAAAQRDHQAAVGQAQTLEVERDIARAAARDAEHQRMDAVSAAAVAQADRDRHRTDLEQTRTQAARQLADLRAETDARIAIERQRAAEATARAETAETQRDELTGKVAAAALRLDDFRATIQQTRDEAAALRERAVTAELALLATRGDTGDQPDESPSPT